MFSIYAFQNQGRWFWSQQETSEAIHCKKIAAGSPAMVLAGPE